MNHSDAVDERLTDLEVKASFTEDLVDRLNDVIVRQQAQIDQLTREVASLIERGNPEDSEVPHLRHDDRPPHY